jgi:hypothetical protein
LDNSLLGAGEEILQSHGISEISKGDCPSDYLEILEIMGSVEFGVSIFKISPK